MSKRYSNYQNPSLSPNNNNENRNGELATHSPKKQQHHFKNYNTNYHYQQQHHHQGHKKYKSGFMTETVKSTEGQIAELTNATVPTENTPVVEQQIVNDDESVLSTTPTDEYKTKTDSVDDQTVAEDEATKTASLTPQVVQYTTVYPATADSGVYSQEYEYTNAVPVLSAQTPPSSYYIYHSPTNSTSATAGNEPPTYYQCPPSYCQPSYVYDPNQQITGYIAPAQVPQQGQAPGSQTMLSSPQPHSTMLTALTSASYQTPPQTSQNNQLYLTQTPVATESLVANTASPQKLNNIHFPYLVPYPTPNTTFSATPNGPSTLIPAHLTPMQTPTSFMMYPGPIQQTPPPSIGAPYVTQTPTRRSWNNPRYNRYNNRNRYSNRMNNVEITPKKCSDSNIYLTASQLTCITDEEQRNYANSQQMMSPPNPATASPIIYSPIQHQQSSYDVQQYCCDTNYYMSTAVPPAAHMISYDQTNSYHAFYPTVSSDYELMNSATASDCGTGLATASVDDISATLAAEYDTYSGEDELKDEHDDKENEQLACYVCRGRRMCFCYFLKVRYYKFPSFLDLVDHQYKKWRSNMVKTRKSQQ